MQMIDITAKSQPSLREAFLSAGAARSTGLRKCKINNYKSEKTKQSENIATGNCMFPSSTDIYMASVLCRL
jgi:hypothetical protein